MTNFVNRLNTRRDPQVDRQLDPVRLALYAVDRDSPSYPQAFASALATYKASQADRDAYVWWWVQQLPPSRA
jgi:hypothetical protein